MPTPASPPCPPAPVWGGPVPPPPARHSWDGLMRLALDLARQGAAAGEVPVGALVAHGDGRILGRAHNACIARNDPTAHAEVLALRRAGETLGNYRLNDCVLVVTLEPCLMCAGALAHARVRGVVYGAPDPRAGAVISCCEGLEMGFLNHRVWHMGGVLHGECATLLREFFHGTRP